MAAGSVHTVGRTITWIAAVSGVLTALAVPALYGYTANSYERYHLQADARRLAGEVSSFIYVSPDTWRFQLYRIEERLGRYLDRAATPKWVRVLDDKGEIVVEVGQPPSMPSISATSVLSDGFATVGRLLVVESVRDVWVGIGMTAVLGIALGLIGFVALRVLPLRALDRALFELRAEVVRRRSAEATLLVNEASLRNAQRIARLGSWDWDLVADTVRWSDELFRIFGVDPGAFQANHEAFLQRVHPEDRERVDKAIRDAIGRRARFDEMEFRIVRPDGQVRMIAALAELAYDEAGRPVRMSGVNQDVTESKAVESQLRQAQKMEALGQLTGGVAHDFNNLLTVILGNAELLEGRVAGDEKLSRFAKAIAKAALRGADLTSRLLVFSRRQALETKVVDLNAAVAAMAPLLRHTLGEAVEIKTAAAADLWPVETDPAQLENALLNLAINARDAMAEGGRITIETANVTLDEDYAARHADVSPGEYAMVAVSDTGTGMPPEVRERAFEPFFTTKAPGKGSGLGLSMVYGLLKQSRGHANIYSEEGHGTTVKLYFPRSRAAADRVETASADGDPPGGRETVLVVEDDAQVRETAVAMLKGLGYRVLEAGDGRTALSVLATRPEVELVFTDVVMPGGMNGIELGREARARRPEIKVLCASGYAEEHLVGSATAGESRLDLIRKPYTRHALAQAVRRVLGA